MRDEPRRRDESRHHRRDRSRRAGAAPSSRAPSSITEGKDKQAQRSNRVRTHSSPTRADLSPARSRLPLAEPLLLTPVLQEAAQFAKIVQNVKESLGGSGVQLTQYNVAQQRIWVVQDVSMKAMKETSKALSQGMRANHAVRLTTHVLYRSCD